MRNAMQALARPAQRDAPHTRGPDAYGQREEAGTGAGGILRQLKMTNNDVNITMMPIGTVRTPFGTTGEIPKGPDAKHDADGVIEIAPAFEAGLQDIEGFSHLYILWHFHRVDGYDLVACPPSDDRPHGVFATRSPFSSQPNWPDCCRAGAPRGSATARPRRRHARRHAGTGHGRTSSIPCGRDPAGSRLRKSAAGAPAADRGHLDAVLRSEPVPDTQKKQRPWRATCRFAGPCFDI